MSHVPFITYEFIMLLIVEEKQRTIAAQRVVEIGPAGRRPCVTCYVEKVGFRLGA